MQTKYEILLLPEVAERLRVSTATVNRLLARRRRGEDDRFPLPLSAFNGKGRWLASDVDAYIGSLSNVNVAVPVPSKRKQERDYQKRQELAKVALERHGIKKGGQES